MPCLAARTRIRALNCFSSQVFAKGTAQVPLDALPADEGTPVDAQLSAASSPARTCAPAINTDDKQVTSHFTCTCNFTLNLF